MKPQSLHTSLPFFIPPDPPKAKPTSVRTPVGALADLATGIFSSQIVCLSCFRPLAFALSPLTALNNFCLSTTLRGLDLLIERKATTAAQAPEGLLVSLRWGSRQQKEERHFRLPWWLLPSACFADSQGT